VVEPGRAELRDEALRPPGPGEVLVRALASGVSRGTESLVFHGRVPASQRAAMRAPFQEGEFPAPVKYGYASVGIVEDGPAALLGRRVFCLFPHQDRYVVPAEAVVPVPDDVPDGRAVLAANMETAVNALWDAAPRIGDRIAVIGAGVVGGLAAGLAARLPGVEVALVDVRPERAALAAALGCDFVSPREARGDADLVIHASGTGEGLATALRLAGFEATVLELSWYGDAPVAAPLGENFHSRRLTLRSSQVGEVAAARRARRSRRDRLSLALELLRDPRFDALVGEAGPFAELPAALARLAASAGPLCHVVRYS
jgi:threonine dehydrogenase-like Zn-dependent dehydrogenase